MDYDKEVVTFLYSVNLVIGVTLTSFGAVYYAAIEKYNTFIKQNVNLIPTLLIIAGSIILTFSFLTVLFLRKLSNNNKAIKKVCLFIFSVLVVMQLAIGIYGSIQARDFNGEMISAIRKDMRKEFIKNNIHEQFNDVFNSLQENLQCCGVFGPEDYEPNVNLPASCCADVSVGEYCERKKLRYRIGCAEKVFEKITPNIYIVSNIALGISFCQIAGLICLGKICCEK